MGYVELGRRATAFSAIAVLLFIVGLALGYGISAVTGGHSSLTSNTTETGNTSTAGSTPSSCPGECKNVNLLEKIKEKGYIVVGTSADWPPYEYVLPNGSYAGIDMVLAKKIAQDLGVKLVIKDMKFDALFQAVQDGKVDIVIADVSMKPSRFQAVDFSIPYMCVDGMDIVMRAQDASSYNGPQSLYGKKIGAQTATTEEDLAKKYFQGKATIETYDKVYPEMILALKTGKIDAVILSPYVAQVIVNMTPGLKIAGQLPYHDCAAVVLPHYALSLKQAVSQTIWDLQQSGQLNQIIEQEMAKWLQSQQSG